MGARKRNALPWPCGLSEAAGIGLLKEANKLECGRIHVIHLTGVANSSGKPCTKGNVFAPTIIRRRRRHQRLPFLHSPPRKRHCRDGWGPFLLLRRE